MDDGVVPCLCNMGRCSPCANARALETFGQGSFLMWTLVAFVPYAGCLISNFKTRSELVSRYDIREGVLKQCLCVLNPCGHYQPLLEFQDQQKGKFGMFGAWAP